MRIVILYHAMDQISGAAKVYAQMASCWAENGHSVTILNHYGKPVSRYPISSKVSIKTAGFFKRFVPFKIIRNLFSPSIIYPLYSAVKNEKADLIIANNAPYYGLLFATMVSKMVGAPLIIWKHSGHFMRSSPMYKIARRYCFPKADAVVLLTEGDRRHALKYNANCFTIMNPIEQNGTAKARDKRAAGADGNNSAIFVGRLAEQKSLDHLFYAWKRALPEIPHWKLTIVGDGEKRKSLEILARQLGIFDAVSFIGAVEDVGSYYENASFFVMSSMHEGLPVSLIEAASSGLPLISYDCPYGPANVIEHDKNGLLIETGNIDALSQAIVSMATSFEMRKSFSDASKLKSNEFLLKTIAKQWDCVFNFVFKKRRFDGGIEGVENGENSEAAFQLTRSSRPKRS